MRCSICGNITDRKVLFNFMELWKEQHEWTDLPQEGIPCRDCIGWIREKGFKICELQCDPMPEVTGPERKWDNVTSIIVGIFDGELLGLRCAKIKYGVDAITEIMQGFRYTDEHGGPIKRATLEDVPETERCSKCWLQLWQCNAQEVTV